MGIQEDFSSSPPLSPSIDSAYMPSSSPIPSSSPVGPSFQTPPTSPPLSPVKDTQLESRRSNNELLTPGTHRELKNVSMDGLLSGFADQHSQSIISPEVSTLPLQHQAPISSPSDHNVESSTVAAGAAENSSNMSATMALSGNTEGKAGLSRESDSNVDAHRLKSMNAIPYPKRPTIAAHRLQQKKLAQPFRSPVLQAPKVEPKPKASATDLRADTITSRSPMPKEGESSQEHVPSLSSPTLDNKIKYRTTRAATQFKSPLAVSNALDDSSLVRLTPTIQALERKLQILKRAVKVREDVQEEVLEGLVRKWSEAGREVAWEVWNLVKDNANSDGGSSNKGKKRTFEGSWGWESSGDAKRQRGEERERNWGWDVVPISGRSEEEEEEEEEEAEEAVASGYEARNHSLGTMLMQLGVAADTLGWNEEEGTFIDK
ncbi:hypothetical protein BYT27DRAFT_6721635 [Phlegmacium glaucopus]|nr:hypothetical protein BYT27DRAFT_6721635 [Phlegmacium glaucopus]